MSNMLKSKWGRSTIQQEAGGSQTPWVVGGGGGCLASGVLSTFLLTSSTGHYYWEKAQWTHACVMTLMFAVTTVCVHIQVGELKAQELERLRNTTLDQYIYKTFKILTKGAVLVLLTFLLLNLAWDKAEGQFILFSSLSSVYKCQGDRGALGLAVSLYGKHMFSSRNEEVLSSSQL